MKLSIHNFTEFSTAYRCPGDFELAICTIAVNHKVEYNIPDCDEWLTLSWTVQNPLQFVFIFKKKNCSTV